MEKPTVLAGDLPGLADLARSLPKAKRDHYRKLREKKEARDAAKGKKPWKPYVKTADGKVHGTADLAASAQYPTKFCTALVALWLRTYQQSSAVWALCFRLASADMLPWNWRWLNGQTVGIPWGEQKGGTHEQCETTVVFEYPFQYFQCKLIKL